MKSIFSLAGATVVLLEVADAASKGSLTFLPLGGSHIAQIAIVFGLAFVVSELAVVLFQ